MHRLPLFEAERWGVYLRGYIFALVGRTCIKKTNNQHHDGSNGYGVTMSLLDKTGEIKGAEK